MVRDPTFHRSVADKILVIDLGRDVELSFLQAGPIITTMIDWDETTEQAKLEGSLAEVARIRMMTPIALSMAMNMLETFIQAGKVKTDVLISTIEKFAADADQKAAEPPTRDASE